MLTGFCRELLTAAEEALSRFTGLNGILNIANQGTLSTLKLEASKLEASSIECKPFVRNRFSKD